MNRIPFERADFDELAEVWSSFYPTRFHVSAEMLRKNTVECAVFDWGASSILEQDGRVIGFVAIKKSANPVLFHGPDKDQAHICALAFDDPATGCDLLAYSKAVLRDRGVLKLVFGQDSRHFFPGCPTDFPKLGSFLTVQGFEEGSLQVDLERDLIDYEPPTGSLDDLKGAEIRSCRPDDVPALEEFLQRTFPGRWTFDTLHKVDQEGNPSFVMGLFRDGACEGFALTQRDGCHLPIGGAVWHKDLGHSWGSLGPIGVSTRVRGTGLGGALLAYGLKTLHEAGARRSIIDWTTLVEFYGKHGFEPTREYRTCALSLE